MTAVPSSTAASGAVSLRSLVAWVVLFIVWGIARQKFEGAGWSGLAQHVSVLELAQIYVIGLLVWHIDPAIRLPGAMALGALCLIATLVLVLRYRPAYASGGLEIALLGLSLLYPSIRLVAWVITLFVFQYLFLAGPFLWLHEAVGSLDAAILRGILTDLGYVALGFGPYVFLQDSAHGINVMGACSSSNVIGTVVVGYCVLVLARRGRLIPQDASWLTAILVSGLLINWVRLTPMAISKEQHQFWHDGTGASLVSLALAALVLAGVALATRDAGRARS